MALRSSATTILFANAILGPQRISGFQIAGSYGFAFENCDIPLNHKASRLEVATVIERLHDVILLEKDVVGGLMRDSERLGYNSIAQTEDHNAME
jgi:hypothetical protein